MAVLLAVATGILSFINYFWQANYPLSEFLKIAGLTAQIVFVILTVAAMLTYRGKRSRLSYDGGHYKVFTFRFAVIVLSLIGNVSVLAVFILRACGIVGAL
jgi:hypothetical protein